ncbi:hypothetical protein G5V57_07355 [Nordella sp. HKS 07]|uniref:hypothetical protein n=1 Tax=Nordella sp. HKS 07 TaxID=2712222 RepID=UPI0013E1E375|nr:hypothetical protein [Nordella sp. HKS 07]QIG47563.1 hypothetical protein G5V57_07355 [Nordella sp. HKS 07]
MRILHLLLYALIVAALACATGPAEAAGKAKPAQAEGALGPAMRFVVVRSHTEGCEPNCPQWISAEGAVTRQTPALFKKFLKQVDKNRLPILINSPGGDLDASMAIGKLIRAHGLDVGVAWTLFAGCWPDDKACKLPAEQRGVYDGIPVTWRAFCISSCTFILAGGRKRLAIGTTIAVTPISVTLTNQKVFWEERYRMVNGKKKIISRKIVRRGPAKTTTTTKLDKASRRTLNTYAAAMGLGKGFLALFGKAIPTSIYYVTGHDALTAKLVTSMDSSRSLVDNQLCQAEPVADNCIERVATIERKSLSP